MEPIVSPFSIYIVSVLGQIKNIAFFITAFCIALLIIYLHKYEWSIRDTYERHTTIVWVMVACWLVNTILPSSHTAANILIASYTTPDNIKYSGGDLLQYIESLANIIYAKNH